MPLNSTAFLELSMLLEVKTGLSFYISHWVPFSPNRVRSSCPGASGGGSGGDASSPPTCQHPPSPTDQTWQGRAGAWPGRAGCLSAIQLGRETLPLSVFVSQISLVATVGAGLTWFCLQDGSRWAEEGRSGMPSAGHQGAGQARCISSRRWAALAGEPPCGLAQGRPGTGEPTRGAEGGGQGWGSRTLRVSV